MGKSTTWMVSMNKLADQGRLGSVMVRLMMVLQDFALANDAMEKWRTEEHPKLQERKRGAARYFLRLQVSHMFEACEIIKNEMEASDELKQAVEACDPQTNKSYRAVLKFLKSDDYKLMLRIRN